MYFQYLRFFLYPPAPTKNQSSVPGADPELKYLPSPNFQHYPKPPCFYLERSFFPRCMTHMLFFIL